MDSGRGRVSDVAAPPADPGALIRSKSYGVLLALAAVIGVLVSVASWGFLELIHYIQQWVFEDLPSGLGFDTVPTWWPLPVLGVAGVIIAFAIVRLPGRGGHEPAKGLEAGPPTKPIDLPGVGLAALASIGLGLVLGPEAPLIALGTGLAVLSVRLAKKDASDQVLGLMAAAASFAAISSLFGSPVIGAVILIEAAGLTGLSTSAYAISPLSLPSYPEPNVAAFAWTILLAVAVAVAVFVIVQIGRKTQGLVAKRPFVVIPVAALVVAGLAIAFGQIS